MVISRDRKRFVSSATALPNTCHPRPSPAATVDEFAVAVSDCGECRAWSLAEELRTTIHALAPVLVGRSFPSGTLSISIGIASLDASACNSATDVGVGETLFASADDALYAAKRRGRNRVQAYAREGSCVA